MRMKYHMNQKLSGRAGKVIVSVLMAVAGIGSLPEGQGTFGPVLFGQEKVELGLEPLAKLPGLQASGNVLLPNGWTLNAQGKQTGLGDLPVHLLAAPSGKELVVLHSGYADHEIITLDPKTLNKISRTAVPQSFYGMAFDRDGKNLIVSGGEDEKIYIYPYDQGHLGPPKTLTLGKKTDKFVVSGLELSQDDQTLYVCGLLGNSLQRVSKPLELAGGADVISSELLKLPEESYPYTALEDAAGGRLFVSLWGRAEI